MTPSRQILWESEWKRAFARNPNLRKGKGVVRVRVPAGTRKVFVPRKRHYTNRVLTEADDNRLVALGDQLEPCVVMRGAYGFGFHECEHHNGALGTPAYYIEEK